MLSQERFGVGGPGSSSMERNGEGRRVGVLSFPDLTVILVGEGVNQWSRVLESLHV